MTQDLGTLPVLGATFEGNGTRFRVWCTTAKIVAVVLYSAQRERLSVTPLSSGGDDLFEAFLSDVGPGALYMFALDGRETPDPYARFLPFGVHGPARVEAPRRVRGAHHGASLPDSVIYELHIGTFTREGTYRAAAQRLSYLRELGITTVELMPLSSFDGQRGWGYDGVMHYAPFPGYGEPEDLRLFIETAHALRMTVLLDVVYNHFGPSGNYLGGYAPEYFTARHRTPWGDGPDFSNRFMRAYVINNARYWLEEFGFDGLRLDATHEIRDDSPTHILQELAELCRSLEPQRIVVAEDERNDPRLMEQFGLSGVWADDFHHVLHVLLTREDDGYYAAYEPSVDALAHTIEQGWLYEGQVTPTTGRPRGAPATTLSAHHFIYCVQNHDQVGNRALGDRLSQLTDLEAYRAASMLLLFLPMVPLLFMGQEWAASTPFQYFTDHEPALGELVTRGRREEFGRFSLFQGAENQNLIPDPQAETTFLNSKLDWDEQTREPHRQVLSVYRAMLKLRSTDPVIASSSRERLRAEAHGPLLAVRRWIGREQHKLIVNFSTESVPLGELAAGFKSILTSGFSYTETDPRLAPHSAVLLKSG
jgi:maltooligosyltrehalose trehalohydrolase